MYDESWPGLKNNKKAQVYPISTVFLLLFDHTDLKIGPRVKTIGFYALELSSALLEGNL